MPVDRMHSEFSTPGINAVSLLSAACGWIALLLLLAWYVFPRVPIVDESVHIAQAQMFASGDWRIHPALSTWPTINLIVSAAVLLPGVDPIGAGRTVIAVFGVIAAAGLFAVSSHFSRDFALTRTFQYVSLPIVLPYCCLVYTDIPALAAILWMMYGALRLRVGLFCASALLAIAFRQVNLVWAMVGIALFAYQMRVVGEVKRAQSYVPLAAFAILICVIWGWIVWSVGGIALTPITQEAHVFRPRGIPNIEFAIGLGGLLFLPVLATTGPRVYAFVKTPKGFTILLLATAFVAFTFIVKHRYNTDPRVTTFVRNWLLAGISQQPWRWVFALFVVTSAIGFVFLRFARGAEALKVPLYIAGALSVLPFALIEHRYYLPLFAMLAAMRQPLSATVEYSQLTYSIVLSFGLICFVVQSHWFL